MADKKIKCEINGHEVEVTKGTVIISAFKKLEQDIAHYCWHPGLSVAGVCRLCLVEIEGIPKLQIACNTEITEGMKISNQSGKVKEAVRWGLEFHLINHPLDCPICDQAGECELQEQYMQFGQYSPNMANPKVKKRKVVDLGPKIVLDSERCILCSRCVRFTEEISQTNELGIFNRGDKSEIGVFKDKPLDNNYSVNTVDICPVGALTSKDFRFQQRVWYLKTADSICTGCSTGCNIQADYNEEAVFRVRPRYSEKINKHWMCDKGREVYQLPNRKNRLLQVQGPANSYDSAQILKKWGSKLSKTSSALMLTAQYTVEEYQDIVATFIRLGGRKDGGIFYWKNNSNSFKDFDGILLRGDRNPNTKGLLKVLEEQGIFVRKWDELEASIKKGEIDTLFVAGPENQKVYPDLQEKLEFFESHLKSCIWWTAHPLPNSDLKKTWQIPSKTFFEKTGTFINFDGIEQKIKSIFSFVSVALSLSESALLLEGKELKKPEPDFLKTTLKSNHFTYRKKVL